MGEGEAEDVGVVAEMTRLGKRKLPRTLADEVEKAGGEIIVACCGPTSLNAAMRKFVADQIDIFSFGQPELEIDVTAAVSE
ncbi:hypothetical protein FRC09_014147 [Ceratobasidium sp. 395]|nr:hypothetical protein FRC09_014147 [Ceratobasidium sp. 395]